MLKFFRKIRQNVIMNNLTSKSTGRATKYILYAIGEIALVMVGILLALQVNNWNEEKKSIKKEQNLLTELKTNLETNIENLEGDIKTQIRGAFCIDFLIDHLENQRSFNDSLSVYLAEADFASDVILTSSAFETIRSIGLDLIRSNNLRSEIINLFDVVNPYLLQETKRLEDQLWPALVAPMYQKYFRIKDGKLFPINYDELLKDEEFINMLSRRGDMRKSSTIRKKTVVKKTQNVIQLIDKELNQ